MPTVDGTFAQSQWPVAKTAATAQRPVIGWRWRPNVPPIADALPTLAQRSRREARGSSPHFGARTVAAAGARAPTATRTRSRSS
jgi:hypothetical protein